MVSQNKIYVMLNGLPGNVSAIIAKGFADDERFFVIPFSLTGPEIETSHYMLNNNNIKLVKPSERDICIKEIKERYSEIIAVDFTHPTAVNTNCSFYVDNNIPFVMGTTGGDRALLEKTVLSGTVKAVIAPNMAKQIVGFQAMVEYAANTFPDLFKGYKLEIKESHQHGKADTSGTAKAMVAYYNKLGIPFADNEIIMERDPEMQKNVWNIPEAHISGHAWHTYTLTSEKDDAEFQFSHNINGREIYAQGTMDAVFFLHKKISQSHDKDKTGKIFTMIDVLKG
ncbi:DapB [Desulfamplus magnetovallimortis]|uniref:4-hydroxy-tetrahydrodipicolinate reductase n=1 Tax=Desulfamplus magnetovallimortis TaxID=1246637 RepID=A0A1W1HDR7_9BACT|nr:dihydrodipicolinate reductase [Desulfamplus magnetovallimortis]SLM30528.1 DapB [Desulfamplus magnetovallimortis]